MRKTPLEIIEAVRRNHGSIVAAAKELGVNRVTVWRWVKRAKSHSHSRIGAFSARYLKRKSTRPHTIHYALSVKEQSAIIALRTKKKYTAEKIKKKLTLSASPLTIHRLLRKQGLLNNYANHRRPRYQQTTHMYLKNTTSIGKLQMDVKYITPELSGLPYTCFEYAVVDIYSRYKEAVILNHLDQDGAILALIEIRKRLPFTPDFIQTDNGNEFQGRFNTYCQDTGLKHHLIHTRTPNENAVIERTFRTDEEEFFFMMERAPKDYDELRLWFAKWLHEYNYERPHLGIDLKTPYEVVAYVMLD
jgi:transposase InsO family protein